MLFRSFSCVFFSCLLQANQTPALIKAADNEAWLAIRQQLYFLNRLAQKTPVCIFVTLFWSPAPNYNIQFIVTQSLTFRVRKCICCQLVYSTSAWWRSRCTCSSRRFSFLPKIFVWLHRDAVRLFVPCGPLRDITVQTGHFKAIVIIAALLLASIKEC